MGGGEPVRQVRTGIGRLGTARRDRRRGEGGRGGGADPLHRTTGPRTGAGDRADGGLFARNTRTVDGRAGRLRRDDCA